MKFYKPKASTFAVSFCAALLLAVYLAAAAPSSNQLPFSIEATEDVAQDFPGAPRVQSFSFGQWKGRWVFIGGRIAGYHNFGGSSADFLKADANKEVWVVDTNVKPAKTYHVPVSLLPTECRDVADEWTASGQLYAQDGSDLYIAGGYGQDHFGKWVTYSTLSRIHLPALIDGVMHAKFPAEAISFISSPDVQSAGGDLLKLPDGYFYLVMGQVFMGNYTTFEGHGEHDAAEVSQRYLNEIRKLKFAETANGKLSVQLVQTFTDPAEFHRRDLNVIKNMTAKGVGLAVYGGVFTPDTQLSYGKPIYLTPGNTPVIDTAFEQKMNTYNTARMVLYSQKMGFSATTFFGGISQHSWNAATNSFVENPRVGNKASGTYLDGMQWSDQISTICRGVTPGAEQTTEQIQGTLPAYIGTGGLFIPLPDIRRAGNDADLLDFDALSGKTMVGYIYGGIRAYPYRFPYDKTALPYNSGAVPTKPSDLIMKVYVQKGRTNWP